MKRAVWALAVLAMSTSALAVPAHTLVERAAQAESHHDAAGAVRALEELVAGGYDGNDILFNLGTVYTQAERYGEAIWCFERVVRRKPFALAAERSLQATRLRLARRDAAHTGHAVVESAPPLSVQLGELLPVEWSVPWVLLGEVALFVAWRWRRRTDSELARVGATAALCGAVLWTGFGASVLIAREVAPPSAIVLHDGLRLLQAPRVDAVPSEAVREGERVVTLHAEAGYVRVRTDRGHTGWVSDRDLGSLGK